MQKEKMWEELKSDLLKGHRSRAEIINDLLISSSTEERTRRLILEVLLDIRELLKKENTK